MAAIDRKAEQCWLPIESNPDIMNKFAYRCGLPETFSFQDVYTITNPDMLNLAYPNSTDVIALIFLYPDNVNQEQYRKEKESDWITKRTVYTSAKQLYYMKQTIDNACGTVAILHAIANNLDSGLELKPKSFLARFFNATKSNTPEERAKALEDDKNISMVHDQIAREGQTAAPNLGDEVDYHYVTFVERGEQLYELDGAKSSPIHCGKSSKETFLMDVVKNCKDYVNRDPENLNFVAIALVKNAV